MVESLRKQVKELQDKVACLPSIPVYEVFIDRTHMEPAGMEVDYSITRGERITSCFMGRRLAVGPLGQ